VIVSFLYITGTRGRSPILSRARKVWVVHIREKCHPTSSWSQYILCIRSLQGFSHTIVQPSVYHAAGVYFQVKLDKMFWKRHWMN